MKTNQNITSLKTNAFGSDAFSTRPFERRYVYKMKRILLLLFLCSGVVAASSPPLSGSFTNNLSIEDTKTFQGVSERDTSELKVNLVIVYNNKGQQFSVQCFKDKKLGFFTSTIVNSLVGEIFIDAGQYCPANRFKVSVDYDWVNLNFNEKSITLFRSPIKVPIEN